MEKKLMNAAFRVLTENSSDLMFLKDINSVYHAASMPFVRMTKHSSPAEIIGLTDAEIFSDHTLAARYLADDRRLLAEGRDLVGYVEPITDDNGNARYGSTSKYILRDEDGQPIGILGITKDITTEYLARQRYQQEFRYLFELPHDTYAVCYVDVDSWRVICQRRQDISKGSIQECGTVEEMSGFAVSSILDQDSEAAGFYRNFTAQRLHEIYSSGRRTLTFRYERRISDGSVRWVHNEVNFLTDVDSGHLCVMLSAKDINELKLEEQRLAKAAKLDLMTMVYNRETAMQYITRVLENEGDRQHALFMLDVDNFKGLNDTLGHQAGDEFLKALARELKTHFRESDIVGRIGGDEFFALMRNVSEREQIERKAQDILDVVSSIAAEYPDICMSGSIGIGIYPRDGSSLSELYSAADEALYRAKRGGKNMYLFHEK